MRREAVLFLVLAGLVGFSGCGLTQPLQSFTHYAKRTFAFRGTDAEHPADEEAEAWVTNAGEEARAGQPRERDPDQWYKKYLMSEKARSIEHNLGVD